MTKIVYNACFGGFGLSEAAYEKLIEWGVPVREYIEQEQGDDGLYKPQPLNDGEVIFDRTPTAGDAMNDAMMKLDHRYWDCWTRESRTHPLIVRVVEELGDKANGPYAELRIRELPPGTKYRIDEYDGNESVMTVDDYEWSMA